MPLHIHEPEVILFAGDTHEDIDHFTYLCETAVDNCAEIIFQLGDLCWYPHTKHGVQFLKAVNSLLDEYNLTLCWIDGNHENFDSLFSGEWQITDIGFWRTGPRMFYVPRATTWSWNGLKFGALGGSYSSNKEDLLVWERRLGVKQMHWYWWPQELPTDNDYSFLITKGKLDVLLTHDRPAHKRVSTSRDLLDERSWHRQRLADIVEATEPRLCVHGHLHAYLGPDAERNWLGLAQNGTGDLSWTLFKLREFKLQSTMLNNL